MKLRLIVGELYHYFDCKFYNKEFKIVELKNAHIITDFLINVHKDFNLQSINHQFIFKYLMFQYDFWNDQEITGFGNHTRLGTIFSKKGYLRFQKALKNDKFSWYNAEKTLQDKYGINRSFLIRYRAKQKRDLTILSVDEESEKKIFEDGDVQLVHCIDSTTLFNHVSEVCMACPARVKCKRLLKVYYKYLHQ